MDKLDYISLIEKRLQTIFNDFQQGLDVPPGVLFRTEGLIEAACHLGFLTDGEAKNLIEKNYQQVFGCAMPASITGDFYIPVQMQRAPVFPSKK